MPWSGADAGKDAAIQRPTLPAARVGVTHYVGTPLTGPQAEFRPNVAPADARRVTVMLYALAGEVPDAAPRLGPSARLVTAVRSGEPVVPSQRLTSNARLIDVPDLVAFVAAVRGGQFGKAYPLDSLTAALTKGVTARVSVTDAATPANLDRRAPRRRAEIVLAKSDGSAAATTQAATQSATGIEALLVVDDAPSPGAVLQREDALIDRPMTDGVSRFAVILPFALEEGGTTSILAIISVEPADKSPSHAEAVDRMNIDLRDAAAKRASGETRSPAIESALQSIAANPTRRYTYLYLADQTGATLTRELALVADANLLKKWSARISADLASANASQDIGWLLDRAALSQIAEMTGTGPVEPELAAVLARYCGEVGRHSDALAEVAKASRSKDDFANRLVAENLVYLEDSSPASRVRAYYWLAARNAAPAKFDPLSTLKERRAALEAATAASTTQRGAP